MGSIENKQLTIEFLERGWNQGDLSSVDHYMAEGFVDHQEPPGGDHRVHIRQVIQMLHTAFPDLHFELHAILAEGDLVFFRSTMTGTQTGSLRNGIPGGVPPTGRKVSVPHMHLVRLVNGKVTDLWHIWDIPLMLRQLGVMPEPQRSAAD